MGKEMYLRGPVAKRTRSKEAEYYIKLHCEYKKKIVEEKTVRNTESVRSDGVKKGSSCGFFREKSLRKASGFGGVCSGDSGRDYLDISDTDSQYGLFLSGISGCAGVISGDEKDGANKCDSTGNLQFETGECVIVSDGENDGGRVGDDNGGVNTCQTSENDSGNLKLGTNTLKKHANICDDNNDGSAGDDKGGVSFSETSDRHTGNLQREFREGIEGNCRDDENGDNNDCNVEVGEISDESVVYLDRDKTTKIKREVNTSIKRKGENSKKKSGDKCVKDVGNGQSAVKKHIRARRKTPDVAKILADVTLENSEIPCEEKEQAVTKSSIPLKFTFGIEETAPPKKSEQQREMDELWDEMDIALCKVVAENTMQADGAINDGLEVILDRDAISIEGNWRDDENGDNNDYNVEVCEISDESVVYLDRDKTTKIKRVVNTSMKRKGENSKKKSGDKCVKDVGNGQTAVKKHIRARRKTPDVAKILADVTLENSEIPCEEKEQAVTKSSIPLKFTFGIEESAPTKKSKQEKEMDELWDEMDIALCEVVAETMQVDGAIDDGLGVILDRDAICVRGDHCFILDEEIGLKCKYCCSVKTEIKYYTVPFDENPFGRSVRRGSFAVEHNNLEDFHCPDMMYNSGLTRDPNFLEQGTVWDIIPGIADGMHQHQKEGFEFLWRNIAGHILMEKLKEDSDGGRGCVISHAPGTGKTRLTIAFLQSYLKQYPLCRSLIIAPCGMLPTWEAEFHKWKIDIPFHNLNSTELLGKENISALKLASKGNSGKKEKLTRMVKLFSWAKGGSILGMSYRLFQELIGAVKNSNPKESEAEKIRKILLEYTGLMVLDEGHTARNDDSLIWQALSKVRTEKRIILSGTPFQNNFDELYNILWLVRPKFAEKIPYIRHKLPKRLGGRKNEAREVWGSLTEQISREKDDLLKAQTLAQLKKVIGPFVHIHKGNVLQEKLPGLRDSLIVLEPCQLQKDLLVDAEKIDHSCFGKEHMISVLSVHPSLLLDIRFDLEKFGQNVDGLERSLRQLRLNPEVGVKTKFLMAFIRLCQAVNERVLVFSQFIHPLGFIIEQLKSRFRWSEGREILSIHGKVDVEKRQQLIKDFNNPKSEAKVLVASTRACSEGINLVGASRVVLLDVVWNPSVERQAISRAYRLGQERVVHIYHLITSGTMEEEKYCRQAEKDRLSDLLFCAEDKADDLQKTPSNLSDDKRDKILKRMIDDEKLKSMFKKIIHQPKCTNLIESFGFPEL